MLILLAALTLATPTFAIKGGELEVPGTVVFETGSDKLKPESDEALQHVVEYLQAKPYVTLLRIEGHDEVQALSEKRALAAARWLIAKGIRCDRLIPVGFGASKPEERRIAFVTAALRGRPLGGASVDGGGKIAGDPCR
jgi:OOP family OmpA-OmpF porin